MNKHLQEYLDRDSSHISVDQRLLKDLLNYGANKKAEAVYYKCLRCRKHTIAARIKIKYNINTNSDAVLAFGMALQTQQLNNKI